VNHHLLWQKIYEFNKTKPCGRTGQYIICKLTKVNDLWIVDRNPMPAKIAE